MSPNFSRMADLALKDRILQNDLLRLRGLSEVKMTEMKEVIKLRQDKGIAAAAAMGEVIPPSIALLILGSITSLSVGTLFIAGSAALSLRQGISVPDKQHSAASSTRDLPENTAQSLSSAAGSPREERPDARVDR